MAATDLAITLTALLKFSAPDGDVRLCDGGQVDHASERYESWHPVFGSVAAWPQVRVAMGDAAESATLKLAPNPDADLADWWRMDLFNRRVQVWQAEVDTDQVTATGAIRLLDMLVDNVGRERGSGGEDLLVLDLVSRTERLFLTNEGNVCSQRHHQSVWPGERGFENCTDVPGLFAWGAVPEAREEKSKGGKKKKNKGS